MHAVKGSWIGQTFALAKSNESGGKKSRIRRSKEERKEMVASFIKKYQSLNNGSFPSLNLTHKEVGGSFYTVREIVRDIIQENRVLGPAKFLPGEHDTDQLLEQYPLGTISTQPHTSLSTSPNGSPFAPDQHESISEEPDLVSEGLAAEVELQGDNGKLINGNHVVLNNDKLVNQNAEGRPSELLEAQEYVKEVAVSKAKVTQIADIAVETFPLRPVTKPSDYLDGDSGDLKTLNKTLEEIDLASENVISMTDGVSSLEETILVDDKPAGALSERSSAFVDDKPMVNLVDPIVESSSLSPSEEESEHEKTGHELSEEGSGLAVEKPKEDPKKIIDPMLESSNSSASVEDFVHEESADASLEQKSALLDGKSVESLVLPTLGISDSSSIKAGIEQDTEVDLDVKAMAETQVVNASNGVEAKTPVNNHASGGSGKSIVQDVVLESKTDGKNTGGSEKGSNQTLKRIELKSWEEVSKDPAEPESNPLLAIFKSFMAALMRFWSE